MRIGGQVVSPLCEPLSAGQSLAFEAGSLDRKDLPIGEGG
jgi:hypothetical protein